ncbi:MAG: hydrogenase maturation protein [Pseudomonadota bacterium]|jgi:hydrogenase maturation protein HypF
MNFINRHHLRIRGIVQGIGFRPFVFNLALELNLKGWVNNDTEGVNVVIDCSEETQKLFIRRLRAEKPKMAQIDDISVSTSRDTDPPFDSFEIRESELTANFAADVLPDLATCSQCVSEINDPSNRRYRYLFTNCTHCGPRFSIITGLPYDRSQTTMSAFIQCNACLREFENPRDRRFHAQPNACADCGPKLTMFASDQTELAQGFSALEKAVEQLKCGKIVAVKGIGGYQLVVDAKNSQALLALRARKVRARKPFAVMVSNIIEVGIYCEVNEIEKAQLQSEAAPIVLLKKKKEGESLSEEVAPENPYLGVFLPNTPLHHWLLQLFEGPLVVTSANLSDEPMVSSEPDVFERLRGVADYFLVHDRPIARPIDDSVVQVTEGQVFVLRAARGLAPLLFKANGSERLFASGPHMKATFALQAKNKIILSQHLGDMESELSQELYQSEFREYSKFYQWNPDGFIHDKHPGYFTSEWIQTQSEALNLPKNSIQHHRAHIYSTLVENQIDSSFLGVAWDGTGYGDDGTIWGGEFFLNDPRSNDLLRVASLRPFLLLGGSSAVRAPWRVALALLFDVDVGLAKEWFLKAQSTKQVQDFEILQQMWQKKINSPVCTSMGRFFEGVAALLGIAQENSFDAEAAMKLEFAAESVSPSVSSCDPWVLQNNFSLLDWREWIRSAARSYLRGESPNQKAIDFHHVLIDSCFSLAEHLNQKTLVLGGGVFQNRILLGGIMKEGVRRNFRVLVPSRVPINDGGVAIGQLRSQKSSL